VTPAEALRQLDELFHLWLLDIESVAYPVIRVPVQEGQTA
jgi:hypothetical protein